MLIGRSASVSVKFELNVMIEIRDKALIGTDSEIAVLTLTVIYYSTRRHISEDSNFHNHCCEKLNDFSFT
jgi:hypothetical protein